MGLEADVDLGGEHVCRPSPWNLPGYTPAKGRAACWSIAARGLDSTSFPAAVNGNIALIERGDQHVQGKNLLAQDAGAVAAVIYNNEAGNFSGTLGDAGSWIPVISLAREDGLRKKRWASIR